MTRKIILTFKKLRCSECNNHTWKYVHSALDYYFCCMRCKSEVIK
jgi:ribosomal protein S27E